MSGQFLGTVQDYQVFAVDGDEVKILHDPGFIEGGNSHVYPGFIPEGQVWVDRNIAQHDWPAIIVHEVTESILMGRGWTYDDAHEVANVYEREYRLKTAAKPREHYKQADPSAHQWTAEDEAKHPRGNQKNPGQFAPGGQGGNRKAESEAKDSAKAVKQPQPAADTSATVDTSDAEPLTIGGRAWQLIRKAGEWLFRKKGSPTWSKADPKMAAAIQRHLDREWNRLHKKHRESAWGHLPEAEQEHRTASRSLSEVMAPVWEGLKQVGIRHAVNAIIGPRANLFISQMVAKINAEQATRAREAREQLRRVQAELAEIVKQKAAIEKQTGRKSAGPEYDPESGQHVTGQQLRQLQRTVQAAVKAQIAAGKKKAREQAAAERAKAAAESDKARRERQQQAEAARKAKQDSLAQSREQRAAAKAQRDEEAQKKQAEKDAAEKRKAEMVAQMNSIRIVERPKKSEEEERAEEEARKNAAAEAAARSAEIAAESRQAKREEAENRYKTVAEEHGVNPDALKEEAQFVAKLRQEEHQAKETAKRHARQITGLTAADVRRMANAGYDYASGHKMPGMADKMANFDVWATEIARQHGNVIGDADDPDANHAEKVWHLIGEGETEKPQWYDPDILREAVPLAARHGRQQEEEPEDGGQGDAWEPSPDDFGYQDEPQPEGAEMIPFSRRGLVERYCRVRRQAILDLYTSMVVEHYAKKAARGQRGFKWTEEDEAKHPRSADGEFTTKGSEEAHKSEEAKEARGATDKGERAKAEPEAKEAKDLTEQAHDVVYQMIQGQLGKEKTIALVKAMGAPTQIALLRQVREAQDNDNQEFLRRFVEAAKEKAKAEREPDEKRTTEAEAEATSTNEAKSTTDATPKPETVVGGVNGGEEGKQDAKEVGDDSTTGTPTSTSPNDSDSPRETASMELRRSLDENYAYARKSSVPNAGEDLLGSARHKANAWQGLEEAEKNGTAEKLVNRAKLLENEPHNLTSTVQRNPLTSLAMHYALKHFPASPKGATERDLRFHKGVVSTVDELNRRNRQQYVEAYRSIKEKAEEIAKAKEEPFDAMRQLGRHVSSLIRQFRGQKDEHQSSGLWSDPYNDTANQLINLQRQLVIGSGNKGIAKDLNTFATTFRDKYGLAKDQWNLSTFSDALSDHISDIMDGASIAKTFGQPSEGKGRPKGEGFSLDSQYVTDIGRKGGKTFEESKPIENTSYLREAVKVRAVQHGNYVPDDERAYHLAKMSESLTDLADALDVPVSHTSWNGRLGIAFGARGRAGARAHYEAGDWTDARKGQCILALTRNKGIGSVAHEWGHFFDNMIGAVTGDKTAFGTAESVRSSSTMPLHQAFRNWHNAALPFRYRVAQWCSDNRVSDGRTRYLTSPIECFARGFERYVQRKLASKGRENTYLVALRKTTHPVWPTDEEMESLDPIYDEMFKDFKESVAKGKYSMKTGGLLPVAENLARQVAEHYAKHRAAPNQSSLWTDEEEKKHPRDESGQWARKGEESVPKAVEPAAGQKGLFGEEPANAATKPPAEPEKTNGKQRQETMFHGLKDAPGQQDLFNVDKGVEEPKPQEIGTDDPQTTPDPETGKMPWQMTKGELTRHTQDWEYTPNSMEPYAGKIPPVGTWRVDQYNGAIEQLRRVPVDQLRITEPEGDVAQRADYLQYVEWAKQGKQAPPITVLHNVNGYWASTNRRRLMAARAAGHNDILAWVSDTDMKTGRPKVTHQQVVAEAVRQGKEIPAEVLKEYPEIKRPNSGESNRLIGDDEKSWQELEENFEKVRDNPPAADSFSLFRAETHARRVVDHFGRKVIQAKADNRLVDAEKAAFAADEMKKEADWYRRILKDRGWFSKTHSSPRRGQADPVHTSKSKYARFLDQIAEHYAKSREKAGK